MYHMLIATAPQLIVSAIYIAFNYQLTLIIHLRDWTRLASRRQPLRVSTPEPGSAQTSTYWLSLPYRYSVTLIVSSIMLSWLMSQALFVYRYTPVNDDEAAYKQHRLWPDNHLVYSAFYALASIAAGVCVFAISLLLGLPKCPPGLPLGPTNSLVIAAAWHPPEGDETAASKLVQWGVVTRASRNIGREEGSILHCTITSRKVEAPTEGFRYA